jgi:type II secretion system protein H
MGRAGAMRHAGYTLVEILVVVVILALAAAIVIAGLGSTNDAQVTSAARVLANDLELVRNMTVTTQVPHGLVFSTDRRSYKVVANYAGQPYGSVTAVAHPVKAGERFEVTLASQAGMGSVSVTSVNFNGRTYVTFDPEGEPSYGGSVTLQAGTSGMIVSVSALTGRVTVTRAGN